MEPFAYFTGETSSFLDNCNIGESHTWINATGSDYSSAANLAPVISGGAARVMIEVYASDPSSSWIALNSSNPTQVLIFLAVGNDVTLYWDDAQEVGIGLTTVIPAGTTLTIKCMTIWTTASDHSAGVNVAWIVI